MSTRIDDTDYLILKSLFEDGRKSLREIARLASISTPTVEKRLRRMINNGVIKKITPILDPNKISDSITAVISLRGPQFRLEQIGEKLSKLEEVRNVWFTLGDSNMIVRLNVANPDDLQHLITENIGNVENVSVTASNIITRTLKDEQTVVLKPGLGLRLKCDYCGGEIKADAHILKIADRERYLCCRGCLASYKQKYKEKIKALQASPNVRA